MNMFNKIWNFLKQIIVGPKFKKYKYTNPAIQNQIKNLKAAWNDEKEGSFGIERLIKFILIIIQFVFPTIYIRHLSGKKGLLCRKLFIELYVVTKTFIPLFYFHFSIIKYNLILVLNCYLMFDTIFYLLGLIFVSDIYAYPISRKRSFLLLMLNYIEITLCFAVLYKGLSIIKGVNCTIQAIYFSFVTFTTLGYGEFIPINNTGRLIVISQLLIMILFIFLFFNTFTSNINEKNDLLKSKAE